MNAWTFLSELQKEIGPRRAGTAGEKRAVEWLEKRCRELGWHPERRSFRYIGGEWYRHGMNLLLVGTGIASIWLPRWLGLSLVALVLSYVLGWHRAVELRLARAVGENLLAGLRRPLSAYIADPQRRPALIYCAHYDTARCVPRWLHPLRGLLRFVVPLAMLALVAYAALELLIAMVRLAAGEMPSTAGLLAVLREVSRWGGVTALILVLPLMALILLLTASALLGRRHDSPGADDNGSGVAVLLEVGRQLSADPPPGVDLFLAFWGAEEQGLFGSRQFVREFGPAFPPERTAVINVDCVGVGEYLSVYAGQGVLRRRFTDPLQLVQLEETARRHGTATVRAWESPITGGSSDHAEWVERGYRLTTTLIRENSRRPTLPALLLGVLLRIPYVTQMELPHIHSQADTLERIDPERLEATTAIAGDFGRQMAARLAGI